MHRQKVVAALLLSAFFPYFPGGLRLEHLSFLLFVLLFGFISISRTRYIYSPVLTMSMMLFSGAVFAFIGSTFLPDTGAMASALAMGTRLALPAVVLGAMVVYLPTNCNLMTTVTRTIVLMAMPVALLALSSRFFDISFILGYFVKNEETAVWSQAFALGRFTGLFNQPLEAGVFYSVALLALVYLVSMKLWRPIIRYLILGIILIGGSLSLSKNFVVLGVLVALAYAVSVRVLSIRSGVIWLGIVIAIIIVWFAFGNEIYTNSFIDLFAEGGFLLALSAGRLGTGDTEVAQLWGQLMTSYNWISGMGLGSYLPLDNGYLEYFYQGGVFSLASYVAFIVTILVTSIKYWSVDESKLLFFLGLYIALASLGGPVITANRANVSLLMLIVSCVLCVRERRKIS